MKISSLRLPTRMPQLYFGRSAMLRNRTPQEKIADNLYAFLIILSDILFFIGGVCGYFINRFYGIILFATLGYLAGIWMRRSLGVRGRNPTTSFFKRIRERAQGSRPGLLEWLIEKVSNTELSQAKCKAIIQVYEKSVSQLKQSRPAEEQNQILADLDARVKKIMYG